jgi:hypothetical protein
LFCFLQDGWYFSKEEKLHVTHSQRVQTEVVCRAIAKGATAGIYPRTLESRYKGKVNWRKYSQKPTITH